MPRVGFEQRCRFLHISDPHQEVSATYIIVGKVDPIHDYILRLSHEIGTYLSIDEMMVQFYGRSQHMIKMPNQQ